MIVSPHRYRAMYTVFWFLGGSLGAMEIVEAFDDRLEGWPMLL